MKGKYLDGEEKERKGEKGRGGQMEGRKRGSKERRKIFK